MQLLGRLEIKSKEKIKEFLDQEHVGRISSIDENGYPQIIPMNFIFLDNAIYMHSHTKGEKLDNVSRNDALHFCCNQRKRRDSQRQTRKNSSPKWIDEKISA